MPIDDEHNPDRLPSEPPEFPDQNYDRKGSMSFGAGPNANGDELSPTNGDSVPTSAAPTPQVDPNTKAVQDVVTSEVYLQLLRAHF